MSKEPTTKAEAIREVAKDNMGLSNKQIENEVRQRFGLNVGHNEIINTVGSMEKRQEIAGYSSYYVNKAKEFLFSVGDLTTSQKLLKIADWKCSHDYRN